MRRLFTLSRSVRVDGVDELPHRRTRTDIEVLVRVAAGRLASSDTQKFNHLAVTRMSNPHRSTCHRVGKDRELASVDLEDVDDRVVIGRFERDDGRKLGDVADTKNGSVDRAHIVAAQPPADTAHHEDVLCAIREMQDAVVARFPLPFAFHDDCLAEIIVVRTRVDVGERLVPAHSDEVEAVLAAQQRPDVDRVHEHVLFDECARDAPSDKRRNRRRDADDEENQLPVFSQRVETADKRIPCRHGAFLMLVAVWRLPQKSSCEQIQNL